MVSTTSAWTLREGFAFCAALTAIGFLLQLSLGAIDWQWFAWPANGVALAALLLLITGMHLSRRRIPAFRFLSTYAAAVPALLLAVALTLVMGLTRQQPDGRWFSNMLASWPFVLAYTYVVLILGLTILRRLHRILHPSTAPRHWRRDVPFLLNHAGLFLALVAATLGSADMQRLRMVATKDTPEQRAFDGQRRVVTLPMSLQLKRFILETYDDGSPRRFASDILLVTRSGRHVEATVDVNHPVKVDGWKIYQYGYDTARGAMSDISIFELVRDPWLPYVYAGIYMMLAGAVFMLIGTKP